MSFQRKSRRYYPTRLAINLSSGVSGAGGTVNQPGFIVVETNYRLYAYTGEAGGGQGKDTGENSVMATFPGWSVERSGIELEGGARGRQVCAPSSFLSLPEPESELQIALIALFSEMLYRFPNMVVAQVTRESVQQAIASGITAQQVALLSGGQGCHGVASHLSTRHMKKGLGRAGRGRREGRWAGCESVSLLFTAALSLGLTVLPVDGSCWKASC